MFRSSRSLFSRWGSTRGRWMTTSSEKVKDIQSFPWLRSKDKPRIEHYPYVTEDSLPIVRLLPTSIQRELSKWVCTRILQMNTGLDYFPDEFMVGAGLATREAMTLLSKELKQKGAEPRISSLFGPALLDRWMSSVPEDTLIDIQLPQIYDVRVEDIWITLGPSAAFSGEEGYETVQWMTLQAGLHAPPPNESFAEHQQRVKESVREGVQISVDVKVDATVVFCATQGNDTVAYDEGRRDVRVRFATPYFTSGRRMVSSRDPETGYPNNDWEWTIVDIDQLIEKEMMDQAKDEQ
ncbi:hypothetical protein BY458DRAFT_527724 [Sporodiniella umbellata]|nr:hypothetical protein BY458DRAFT_527724 [Sporodiniella umbellata]